MHKGEKKMSDKCKKDAHRKKQQKFLKGEMNTATVFDSGNSKNNINICSKSDAKVHSSAEAEAEQDF